jgi:hypothetical protein
LNSIEFFFKYGLVYMRLEHDIKYTVHSNLKHLFETFQISCCLIKCEQTWVMSVRSDYIGYHLVVSGPWDWLQSLTLMWKKKYMLIWSWALCALCVP